MSASRGRLEVVLFAIGLAMSGLVLLALLWSGDGPYVDMARTNRIVGATFIDQTTGANVNMELGPLVQEHRVWSAYVTGGAADPPGPGRFYTADELSHMKDVRRVFDGAKIFVPAGFFVMALRLQRARARGVAAMLLVIRDGALGAGVAVAAVGIVAAFAFDAAFMLFHQIFFPQGNFLFDPAASNLVRLYQPWYWEGITARIGLSFVGFAAAVAFAASLGLRRARSTRLATQ